MQDAPRPAASGLLADLGLAPRLIVYLAIAPGAGKTRRLLSDALLEAKAGRRVAIGWVETKGRPDLDELAAQLPRIPERVVERSGARYADFDYDAALAGDAELIVLDELAHANAPGGAHAKRWQDALALREAGRSVIGAFNIAHLESVAGAAERIIGYPVRELVPLSFLKAADGVVALDVSPELLEARLYAGRIVAGDDIARAAEGAFRPAALTLLRQLLLRTIDDLTVPVLSPSSVAAGLALVTAGIDAAEFLRRVAPLAEALDLALEAAACEGVDPVAFDEAALSADAYRVDAPPGVRRGRIEDVRASLIAVPSGDLAMRLLGHPSERLLYVADTRRSRPRALQTRATDGQARRIGKLTVFAGSVAGSGKTFAMLDRARQLRDAGIDVVGAFVETHGRAETDAKLEGLELLPRTAGGELDIDALLARRPAVALIDEFAHTNAPGSRHEKRYGDVLDALAAGIDVMTTLNVQHLEGVAEAVRRMTGTVVRERLPDGALATADEIVFVDVTPQMLRERLRAGKIYPLDRVESALGNFFRADRLAALRELAVREVAHALRKRRGVLPFDRIVLGVAPRERDIELVGRIAPLASRLNVGLRVIAVGDPASNRDAVAQLQAAAQRVSAEFSLQAGRDAAQTLVGLSTDGDVIAVESPRRPKGWFSPHSMAARLVEAGARELLVLPPKR